MELIIYFNFKHKNGDGSAEVNVNIIEWLFPIILHNWFIKHIEENKEIANVNIISQIRSFKKDKNDK